MINILDTGRFFINLNEKDSRGRTILTSFAANYGPGYNADKFAVLLDRGADIHIRNAHGQTCLHVAVVNANYVDVESDARAIILLIERGADISTLDDRGRSIFHDAYECHHDRWWRASGSYRGDLWDHVLIRCGYGERIRPPEERIYHYTHRYTEDKFRSLWEGWEHLFPYTRETSSPCSVLILKDEYEDDEYEDDEYEDDEYEDDEYEDEGKSNDEGRHRAEEDADEDQG